MRWDDETWTERALPEAGLRKRLAKVEEVLADGEDVAGLEGAPYVAILAAHVGEYAGHAHGPETAFRLRLARDTAVVVAAAALRAAEAAELRLAAVGPEAHVERVS